jgi:hypothetical protein
MNFSLVEMIMEFTDFDKTRIENAVEAVLGKRRPSSNAGKEGNLGYRIAGQSIEIFAVRPSFRDEKVLQEIPIAKVTFTESRKVWNLFWYRSDLRWHKYDPLPAAGTMEELLAEINADPYACFWG